MSQRAAWLIFIATAGFLGAFLLWPTWQILRGGFVDTGGNFTLGYFTAVLADPLYRDGLLNSFLLACATTAIAAAIAVPLAFAADRYRFFGKTFLTSLLLVPLILPPFVGAIGLKQILGQYGALNALLQHLGILASGETIDWLAQNKFLGVAIIQALGLYPVLYLNTAAALANIDPAMDEAAASLGSTGLRRFFKITVPLMMPGLFAGGTIVFIWAFTELGVPLIFDYPRVTAVQIFHGVKDIAGSPAPYALVAWMLITTVALYALSKAILGRHSYAMMAKSTSAKTERALPPLKNALCVAGFFAVTFAAILPHLGVFLVAFSSDWYASVFPQNFTLGNIELALGHSLTVPSIANSLKYASLSAIVDLFLGVAIAFVIVRSRIPGRDALDAIAMLPLAVPGLVLAFGYLAMTQEGRFFGFLNPIENPTPLLVIACAVRRLPYVVRAAAAGFQQTSVTLEEAAQNLGATPWRALRRATLPLIAPSLAAGALLAFAFAMLEVSDSLLLAQKQAFFPITKAIYELFQLLGDGKFLASALGVWAMAFLGVAVATAGALLGKRFGALFRF